MEIPGYLIQKQIGKGGMATVYLARQESLDRLVVLKILDNVRTDKEEWRERFMSEGRLVASLHHPNIITIFDIGISNDNYYISMEYVDGGDLKQKMKSQLSTHECLDYLDKIASALGAAHRHGIVHRDVKPANILFRNDNTLLLTDFGIAKQIDMDMDLTSTGIFLGSPNYVSPEQAQGHTVDGRTDIYSLGCMLHEMLTGTKPYVSDSVIEIVLQHRDAPVPQLPTEFEGLQALLNRMMAKDVNQRFRNCDELCAELRTHRERELQKVSMSDLDLTVEAPKDSQTGKDKSDKNTNRLLIIALVFALAINVVLKVIEMRLEGNDQQGASVQTTLSGNRPVLPATSTETTQAQTAEPVSPEIKRALLWLGKRSLDEFKLTYPPKDNALYYYTRMLEIEPGNKEAMRGINNIAEQYAILADQAMSKNDYEKSMSYINLGLQIDPNNESLQALKLLIADLQHQSLWSTFMQLFKG